MSENMDSGRRREVADVPRGTGGREGMKRRSGEGGLVCTENLNPEVVVMKSAQDSK